MIISKRVFAFMKNRNVSESTAPARGVAKLLRGLVPKFYINFEEILSRAHRNFEVQNTASVSSTIIINYCIV